MTRSLTTGFVALTSAALIGCNTGPGAGEQAVAFEATDATGQTVALADYAGRVTVLDFFATWCGHCTKASPYVQRLHERYSDDERVAIVAVHRDVDYRRGHPADYMAEHNYTFDLIPDGREVASAYGIWSLPQFIIIDQDGTIVHRQAGFGENDIEAFAGIIDSTLEQGAG
ncbi:MAG: TlpA disulfide reductase family protein [Planctomycetota bacterium]